MSNQAIIKTETGECINIIVPWASPEGCVAVDQNEIQIGDVCEQINGIWQKKIS